MTSDTDATWQSAKAFVGGGDLNAGLREPAPRRSLSLLVDNHRRDASLGSIGSLEDAPSPIPNYVALPPTGVSPPPSTHSHNPNDKELPRLRTGSDLSMDIPLPLPSPMPGFEGSVREFRNLSDTPHSGGGAFASGGLVTPLLASPLPVSPWNVNERDILAGTPQNDGAVSPALSTGSKTDAFFGASQRESLPVPPLPLRDGSPVSAGGSPVVTSPWSGLGRTPSIGRGLPSSASRNRIVTGPASSTEPFATSPTSPTLIAPTPLRSVTGPAPPVLSASPSPTPDMSSHLSPRSASRERYPVGRPRRASHIAREAHHTEPGCRPVQVGDVLTPVADDASFPIKSSKDPGTWRIIQSLGFGAFASVWSAKPETPGAEEVVEAGVSLVPSPDRGGVCAVKMVDRKSCERNSRTASAFYREVEVLRHLVHQGVVGYVAHFSTASHHCLVLERLQGGELFSLVEMDSNRTRMMRPGPGDPEGYGLVRRIFGELCRAVSWLHEVEVVHRDIKLESESGGRHSAIANHRYPLHREPIQTSANLDGLGSSRGAPHPACQAYGLWPRSLHPCKLAIAAYSVWKRGICRPRGGHGQPVRRAQD